MTARRITDRLARRRRSAPVVAAVLLEAIAAIIAAAAVLFGGRALWLDLPVVFRDAPPSVLTSPFRQQMQTVLRTLPPGVPVLCIRSVGETWYSRLWERALYPRNAVVLLANPDPAALRRAREAYGTRYAIWVGFPPSATPHARNIPLGSLPGLPHESWFGKLEP